MKSKTLRVYADTSVFGGVLRIQVRTFWRQQYDLCIAEVEDTFEWKKLRVPGKQDVFGVIEKSVVAVRQIPSHLLHPRAVRIGRYSCDLNPAR